MVPDEDDLIDDRVTRRVDEAGGAPAVETTSAPAAPAAPEAPAAEGVGATDESCAVEASKSQGAPGAVLDGGTLEVDWAPADEESKSRSKEETSRDGGSNGADGKSELTCCVNCSVTSGW